MTSRRNAVVEQRETRLAAIRQKLRGSHFAIHHDTQANLQRILLDSLLRADDERAQVFSLESTTLFWCFSLEDATIYRNFFARCLQGTWNVTLAHESGDFSFQFARA